MGTVTILLGFAAGLSVGFILGRVFERLSYFRQSRPSHAD